MERYTIGGIIGKGQYGNVYLAKCRETGKSYALKCHKNNDGIDDTYDNGITESAVREISCLSVLKGHPNIVEMLDCILHDGEMSVLMPYYPFSLFDVIYREQRSLDRLPIAFIARFSTQIANALSYMHGLNMIHRDLKPANVLLTADTFTVKVADMGLSRYAVAKGMSSTVVTKPYRAPELFNVNYIAPYTCAVDMWSLGVMIADAMEGKIVFCHSEIPTDELIAVTLDPTQRNTRNPRRNNRNPSRDSLMPNVMNHKCVSRIVFKLLHIDPKKRLTARSLLADRQWRQSSSGVTPDIIEHVKAYAGITVPPK